MTTPAQCRAARGLVGLTQEQLAVATNIAASVVEDFEADLSMPILDDIEAITRALEAAGAVFFDGQYSGIGGPGVRLAKPLKSFDTIESEVIQYPEYLENDAPPGAGG